jgi:hypothetical protein
MRHQILTAQKNAKKKKKSKAGRGPPPPGHDHAAAGRRSSVPHASNATTTTCRPHCSVRRCLTSAALSGAWAVTRVGRESPHRARSLASASADGTRREGAAAPRPESEPPQPSRRGSRAHRARGRRRHVGRRPAGARPDPVPDGAPPLLPRPRKEGVEPPRCGGGGGWTPRRVMAGDAPRWIRLQRWPPTE